LAETDARMIKDLTIGKYFSYIIQTVTGKGSGDRVRKGLVVGSGVWGVGSGEWENQKSNPPLSAFILSHSLPF
jgi:hypothetical protein